MINRIKNYKEEVAQSGYVEVKEIEGWTVYLKISYDPKYTKDNTNNKDNYINRVTKDIKNQIHKKYLKILKNTLTKHDNKRQENISHNSHKNLVSSEHYGYIPKDDTDTFVSVGLEPCSNPPFSVSSAHSKNFGIRSLDSITGSNEDLSRYINFKSLNTLLDTDTLVVGFDTEYETHPCGTDTNGVLHTKDVVVSYQFATQKNDFLYTFVFIRTEKSSEYISIDGALGFILSVIGANFININCLPDVAHRCCSPKSKFFVPTLSVTLVSHNGIMDIPKLTFHQSIVLKTIRDRDSGVFDIRLLQPKCYMTQIQGGLCTSTPIFYDLFKWNDKNLVLPINLSIRDTMAHSVSGKGLDDIGKTVGYQKLSIDKSWYLKMSEFEREHPKEFFDYAARDAEICVMYLKEMYGQNTKVPLTAMSAVTQVAKSVYKDLIWNDRQARKDIQDFIASCDYGSIPLTTDSESDSSKDVCNDNYFNLFYRGVLQVPKGKKLQTDLTTNNKLYDISRLSYVSSYAQIVTGMAEESFCGGLNESFKYGWFNEHTIDVDLEAAYASIMTGLYDVNLLKEPLYTCSKRHTVTNGDEYIKNIWDKIIPHSDSYRPLNWPIYVAVSEFEFPEDCYKPCIPIQVDGSLIYPLQAKRPVFITGPELYMALKMGAKITIDHMYVMDVYRDERGIPTHHYGEMLLNFLRKRMKAQKDVGKKSFPDLVLKLACNALYGKTAQGIRKTTIYDPITGESDDLGPSPITNPLYATMITSMIRTILIATINELHDKGYTVYSVTTDGFITNASLDFIDSLDLFGFSNIYRDAHKVADGNPVMWSIKHEQDYLFQWCTRLNIGFDADQIHRDTQVFARASYKDTEEYDPFLEEAQVTDLEALNYFRKILEGFVVVSNQRGQTNAKDWSKKGIFPHSFWKNRTLKLQPDFKRGVCEGYEEVEINFRNIKGSIVCFDTEPYRNMDEYYKYHDSIKNISTPIRTKADMDAALRTIRAEGMLYRKDDPQQKQDCKYILRGYFSKQISIPVFEDDKGKTKSQKELCIIINDYLKDYDCKITINDVKNASRRFFAITPDRYKLLAPTLKAIGGGNLIE